MMCRTGWLYFSDNRMADGARTSLKVQYLHIVLHMAMKLRINPCNLKPYHIVQGLVQGPSLEFARQRLEVSRDNTWCHRNLARPLTSWGSLGWHQIACQHFSLLCAASEPCVEDWVEASFASAYPSGLFLPGAANASNHAISSATKIPPRVAWLFRPIDKNRLA